MKKKVKKPQSAQNLRGKIHKLFLHFGLDDAFKDVKLEISRTQKEEKKEKRWFRIY